MNAVGIDVSKGKSMVAILRPFGEVVAVPYEVSHTDSELDQLAKVIKKLPGTPVRHDQTCAKDKMPEALLEALKRSAERLE